MPAGRPTMTDRGPSIAHEFTMAGAQNGESSQVGQLRQLSPDLPQPVTSPQAQSHPNHPSHRLNCPEKRETAVELQDYGNQNTSTAQTHSRDRKRVILPLSEEESLCPASMPPKYHVCDLFPFSLLIKFLVERGQSLKGRKAARLRTRMQSMAVSHNLPLELSLYLVRLITLFEDMD